MDTTHPSDPGRSGADLAEVDRLEAAADELLATLAAMDAAEAPPVADELASTLTLTLDLRDDAAERPG